MKTRSTVLRSAIGLTVLALAVTACSSSPSPGAAASTVSSSAAQKTTVLVENAKPTLVQKTEDGETFSAEDTAVARSSVEVPYQPASIVTFDIATLDTLDAIGAGKSVVGIPQIPLPEYLAEYKDMPKVGTLFEPDFEAVAELDPELIVTAARSTGQYDELAKIATTIDLTGTYGGTFDPDAGLVRAAQLGEIFGAETAVAEKRTAIEQQISTISAADKGTALVLSVSGGEYGVFGEGSRFGYFFDKLGFTPAVPATQLPGAEGSPHGDSVTNEFILSANPDWILAFDRGAATGEGSSAKETLTNEIVGRTTAATNGHIVYLPANELYIVINGLSAIHGVLDTVQQAVTA